MDFHWDWGCNTLFEEGCGCSDELPPLGAIAQILQARPDWPHQVTWLGARSTVHDFSAKPPELYETREEAIAAVEVAVRHAGHTIGGV